jgi:hypothetical protein
MEQAEERVVLEQLHHYAWDTMLRNIFPLNLF